MKKVTVKNKEIKISAADERVIRHLADSGFVDRVSAFEQSGGRWKRNDAISTSKHREENHVGVRLFRRDHPGQPAIVRKFFEKNPRNDFAVWGNPKVIKPILAELDK